MTNKEVAELLELCHMWDGIASEIDGVEYVDHSITRNMGTAPDLVRYTLKVPIVVTMEVPSKELSPAPASTDMERTSQVIRGHAMLEVLRSLKRLISLSSRAAGMALAVAAMNGGSNG